MHDYYVGWSQMERYRYDAYGAVTITDANGTVLPTSAWGNRFLYTGREWIAELGIYDYRNRQYSPQLGRFLQTDPIRFDAGDVNLYRYVGNDPVNWVDPFGLIANRIEKAWNCRNLPRKAFKCGKEIGEIASDPKAYTADCRKAGKFAKRAPKLPKEFDDLVHESQRELIDEIGGGAPGLSFGAGQQIAIASYSRAKSKFKTKYADELRALENCTCAKACGELASTIKSCFGF